MRIKNAIFTGIAALALAMVTLTGEAQNVVYELALTNTIALTNNATVVVGDANNPFSAPLPSGSGLTLLFMNYPDGAGTSNNTYYFNLGSQGTNWTTDYPLNATVACGGSNVVTRSRVYFSLTNFAGFDQIRCDKFTTAQTNNVHSRIFELTPVYQH